MRGVVQGVGFRPFVHRIATRGDLAGSVWNDGDGVVVEVEGAPERRSTRSPARSSTRRRPWRGSPRSQASGSSRSESTRSSWRRATAAAASALVPPDVATCDDCLRELFDPADRRYRYPFVNCTNCGPRLTIVTRVPYDRPNTTMAGFPLCADCRREYEDPTDRRFHAEPIACPACGPQLSLPLERGRRRAARRRDRRGEGARGLPPRLRRDERGGGRAPARAQGPGGEAAGGDVRRPVRARGADAGGARAARARPRARSCSCGAARAARRSPPRSRPGRRGSG